MFFKLGTGSAVKERITLLNQSSYLSQVKKTEYSTKVCFQTVTLGKSTENAVFFVLAHLGG